MRALGLRDEQYSLVFLTNLQQQPSSEGLCASEAACDFLTLRSIYRAQSPAEYGVLVTGTKRRHRVVPWAREKSAAFVVAG